MATDYLFQEVPVFDRLGVNLMLARNVRIDVLDTVLDVVSPGLKQQGQPVSFVKTDELGRATFTNTQGFARLRGPKGFEQIVYSPQYLDDVKSAGANAQAAAASAAASAALVGAPAGAAVDARINSGASPAVRKGDIVINVKDPAYGAKGDGTTLDHAAINAAITAGAGRVVFIPAGTYLIDATSPNGIKLNQPGTKLLLDQGAVIKVQTNNQSAYMALEVTAADCVIEGGTFLGDVDTHTGTTGEWGHLIVANPGSDRLRISGVKVTKAWGDGITLQGGSADISVTDVVADDNRRQGMSIIAAVRPRVTGGVYRNTGLTKNTAPSAGIDVEPNATTSVTDCVISGVTFTGNKGPGLQVATAAGSVAEVTVTGCRSTGGAFYGFYLVGPDDTIKAKLTACHALTNALHGFVINTNKVELSACTARANTQYGFQVLTADAILVDPVAVENGRHGMSLVGARCKVIGGTTRANSQAGNGLYINIDIQGGPATLIGHLADAGQLANKPNWGIVVRTGIPARLIGCDVDGTYVSTAVLDQPGNTPMFPKPGAAKQALSAAATDAATTQALANSLRTALINLGYA